jgi:hypothetical protein
MPASLGTEEKLLELLLKKKAWTETKAYIGLSTLAAPTKKTTAKEFGEAEFKEAEGWKRIEVDTIEWETVKAEGATGFTIFKNKNAIVFEKITGAEEKTLETFAILEKAKQSEDAAESKGIFLFGKLTTKVTINKATTEFSIPAKELVIECE